MDFGPEFILAVIAIVAFSRVLRTAINARHGIAEPFAGRRGRRAANDAAQGELADLRQTNAQLTRRLESYEDRLEVLERIVTDKSYNLASEIEALRDRSGSGVPLDLPRKENAK